MMQTTINHVGSGHWHAGGSEGAGFVWRRPNRRLKLPARGGRASREWSFLSAAAAGRSLSASR